MPLLLIDTNVAVHLRDRDALVIARLADLDDTPALSVISEIELEGGVVAKMPFRETRRAALDAMLKEMVVLDVDRPVVTAYRSIVEAIGYSRSRILDRMIAATALAHDLTLATINGADFRDIPGLKLEIWPSPAAQ